MKKLALTLASVALISGAGVLVSGGATAGSTGPYTCDSPGQSDQYEVVHITNPTTGHGKIWTCQKVNGSPSSPNYYDDSLLVRIHGNH